MRKFILLGFLLAGGVAQAQPVLTHDKLDAPTVMTGDYWDAFIEVTYMGGDASLEKRRIGLLILTDTALSFYECENSRCIMDKKKSVVKKGPPMWSVKLGQIKEISGSTQYKGTSTGAKLLLGAFAGDKSAELIGFVYETGNTVEAPVFKTREAQSGAIEAKLRYRMEKLGLPSPKSP